MFMESSAQMEIPTEYTYEIDAAMEQWTDQRVIHSDDLADLLLFHLYIPKVTSQLGTKILGYTCRQKNGQTLMAVKAREGDTPLVVFVTAASTIGCMSRFVVLLEEDRLTWVRDKYPWI